MPSVNYEWVADQLTQKKTRKVAGDAVMSLLKAWESLRLSDTEAKETAEAFSKLAMGVPIVDQAKPEEVWVEARPGAIKVGDEIMVKPDAFVGDHGVMHNGRRGRIVAIRYGDIIVNSIDGIEPELRGTHYSPSHLLKLVSR